MEKRFSYSDRRQSREKKYTWNKNKIKPNPSPIGLLLLLAKRNASRREQAVTTRVETRKTNAAALTRQSASAFPVVFPSHVFPIVSGANMTEPELEPYTLAERHTTLAR